MRIVTVIGNRPQFVKAAAVSPLLREHHDDVMVHTGQHHDDELSQVFVRELGAPQPEHELAIHGGSNTNVVPDRVTMRIDRRMIPEEAGFDADGELRRIIEDAVESAPGIQVTIRRILLAEPLIELPAAAPLIAALKARAAQVMNVAVPVHGAPLYTDARHYAARGIPTVLYGAGPRTLMEARGHNTDENLRLEDLRKATCVLALTLADLMG